jgi:hypothetical protein
MRWLIMPITLSFRRLLCLDLEPQAYVIYSRGPRCVEQASKHIPRPQPFSPMLTGHTKQQRIRKRPPRHLLSRLLMSVVEPNAVALSAFSTHPACLVSLYWAMNRSLPVLQIQVESTRTSRFALGGSLGELVHGVLSNDATHPRPRNIAFANAHCSFYYNGSTAMDNGVVMRGLA